MLALWGLAALGCLLGALAPVPDEPGTGFPGQLLDLVRILSTVALAIVLLLGPGILWRAGSRRRVGLAFLPLPGLFGLVATAGLAWMLAGSVEPRVVCFAVLAPLLGLMLGALVGAGPEPMLEPEEQRALILISLALGVAVGRSIWSMGVVGELYEGTISRNLVSEPRPDSRTPYLVTELIANGFGPYDPRLNLFAPYNFSSRGPLAGMATTPLVLLTGGRPPLGPPEMPWHPFDPQGFMAFRLAMITLSCTALLALWELVRRLGGDLAARLALLLGIATPFFLADLLFTWPKLFAAGLVLLSAILVIERKPLRSGLMAGLSYLTHPSALLSVPTLGLLALWPPRGASWKRPNLLAGVLLAAGVGATMLGWKLVNGPHYIQNGFYDYFTQAYPEYFPTVGEWIEFRLNSLGNTLVPLFLPLAHPDDVSINPLFGSTNGAVHFFFQYWTGLPFGYGILFFPLLLAALFRATRRWPWAVTVVVFFPFLLFTAYWGASLSGMLREGLQAWALVLLAVIALEQAAGGLPWARSRPVRAILALRAVEVLAVAIGPVIATHGLDPGSGSLALNDGVALLLMVGCSAAIAAAVWRETGRLGLHRSREGRGPEPG
jgi:hypothetical protein